MLNQNLQDTLDSLSHHIAVIDSNATIVLVNKAWKKFGEENGLCSFNHCVGLNYIEICRNASIESKKEAKEFTENINAEECKHSINTEKYKNSIATEECGSSIGAEECGSFIATEECGSSIGAEECAKGIEKMLSGQINNFSIDYPCHSPCKITHSQVQKRWFRMTLIRFYFEEKAWIVILHENITQVKIAELNLIKSENKLKGIVQSIPDAMCMIDKNQNVIWANDIAKTMYGSSLVGEKCYRVYGRWNELCDNCIVHKTFIDGKVYSEEYSHWGIDGNEKTIFCTSSVAGYDEEGNITHVMEIMRDITEKKHHEKILKFMQLAVDTTGDGIYWINPDGSIRYVNQAVLKYTGYTEKEITALKVKDIDPNVNEESWADHWNALQNSQTIRLETIHRTKDGIDIPFEVTANHVIFNKGEEYNFAVARNISERKQTEREIKRLSQAVEYSPASVVITDVSGKIEYVNRKFTQVTEYTREEAIGQNPRILNAGSRAKGYYTNLWNTILNGKEWRGEFINKKKSGELYWESASISPVVDENGTIAYFVAIKEDITDRKKIMEELKSAKKKAESATQAKTDFLATMSHEIRTPMNAIMGMCHLMMDTELNDTQYSYLSNIQSASNSLLAIINDILDISKIEAGKMEFESIDFELHQIIEKIFNVLKFTANEKQLELIYSFGKNIPRFMLGDPTRLSQVIMNLAGNAVKYTPAGEVLVHTELVTEDEKTITIKVSIKDTGIGITESKLSSLFTPFTQVDSSTTRKYGGTGLGLVIAKRLVNKMGGDIEVQSVPEKGSTFSFTVVLNKMIQPKVPGIDINDLFDLRVMVIEPHFSARRALSTTLKSLNMRVMAVSNGDEAVELMELTSDTKISDTKTLDTKTLNTKTLNTKTLNTKTLNTKTLNTKTLNTKTHEIKNSHPKIPNKPAFDIVLINLNLPTNSKSCLETLRDLSSRIAISSASTTSNIKTKYIVMHDFKFNDQARKIAEQLAGEVNVNGFLPRPVTPLILIKTILNSMEKDSNRNNDLKRNKQPSTESILEQFKNKHLLVVDDDEINRQIVLALLKKSGIQNISLGVNGEQAVKMVQAHLFDLILMDVEMPLMDGLEATRQIRALNNKIPIIALTGHALDEYREKCFKAGMNDHIDKPIQPEKLFHVLEKWLLIQK